MALADDYKRLESEYRVARQRIEKLQSNIRILRSTNEDLVERAEKMQKLLKSYKEGFEEIFIHDVGAAWDNVPVSERDAMSIDDKVDFFKREAANLQAYMKKTLYEFQKNTIDEMESLRKENKELKAGGKTKSSLEKVDEQINSLAQNLKEKQSSQEYLKTIGEKTPVKASFAFFASKETTKPSDEEIHTQSEESLPKETLIENQESFPAVEASKSSVAENIMRNMMHPQEQESGDLPKPEENAAEDNVLAQNKTDVPTHPLKEQFESMTDEEKDSIELRSNQFISGDLALENREVFLLLLMGTSGKGLVKDLTELAKNGNVSLGIDTMGERHIQEKCVSLENKGLVVRTVVNTGGRGKAPLFSKLSTQGQWVYFFLSNRENPVVAEVDVVAADQKSLEHGMTIKDIGKNLEALGYKVTYEEEGFSDEGKTIADIFATYGSLSYHIEYEEGNYPKEKYIDKFLRICEAGRNIIFIGRDKSVSHKLSEIYKEFLSLYPEWEDRRYSRFLTVADFQGGNDPLDKDRY